MPSYYIDKTSWPATGIWSAPTRSPILSHTFMRASTPQIPVRFVSAGTVVELGNTSTVGLGLKSTRASGSWLITPATHTKTGTGTATVYTLAPTIMGSTLDTLLGSSDSVAVIGELYWTDSGTGGTAGTFGSGSIQFAARVYKNLNVGGETVPLIGPWIAIDNTDTGLTLEVGAQYLADTSTAAFSVLLPASPAVGDEIIVADAQQTWPVRNLTIQRNGQLMNGTTENLACNISARISLVFVGGAQGWEVYA